MDARAILAKLRHKQTPTKEELAWMAHGLADGTITDAQAGAFAMAVCLNGLSDVGRVALTIAMRDSGRVLHWDVDGPVLDKHSTGGIGDCVSLLLAPALAACGAYVPMISGRGLGHTGGTLDKLEAIPGVNTHLSEAELKGIVRQVGCAIVGATSDIAPADKRLYAVRDNSSTVDSLDLITASILSKKLAAGIDGLVLDVKVGSGAFMKTLAEGQALAEALTKTANASKCRTTAVISDMSQPLVPSVGNALEVAEVMRLLTGNGRGPIVDVAAALGGVLLANSGLAQDVQEGADAVVHAIRKGYAAERFARMLSALGGPVNFVDDWRRFLPEATVIRQVNAVQDGYVARIDGQALGWAVVGLGGGRMYEEDRINPAVGISDVVRLGTQVKKGQTLAVVHAVRSDQADAAVRDTLQAITLSGSRPKVPDQILERVG
ncbi:Thymidine phosphorylase [Sulfitobacter noctilucicola]|uniref:Thymidine phosphorylase n=1 Tax=Sulfitobacter noctilucicola TaxID=1342301 RepID=A0A7W6M7J0_9RHOB|nr:thymidine phosphorylase [Sulfitobacter noctilucicola]KIN61971.1 Thymidine phosphorylase [Sulfitobacter noctilucicola]MBB4173508.1 thymidine phosphorylase [Sulfitobacter noctilucicola]